MKPTVLLTVLLLVCSNLLFACASGGSNSAARAYGTTDRTGWTPLHRAAYGGHPKRTRFLLNGGADPNARAHDGNTPLHLAAAGGHERTVRELIVSGADLRIRNDAGDLPIDLARRFGHSKTARALEGG